MTQRRQICICICTYKRPELLRKLLFKLSSLETGDIFRFSIVVVDNDREESSRIVVESFASGSNISISYYVEPEQNIALARNKAIENASGDFIAFIDDDEFPNSQWLINFLKAIEKYKSDGVLGPVLPFFEIKPPKWVLKGGFFERPNHPTGHILDWENTRTGNALLRSEIFMGDSRPFNPEFGSGGEDRDFFRRMIDKGYRFSWCAEAPVYETVPAERCKRSFMLKRALLRGKIPQFTHVDYAKSLVAIPLYTALLPILIVAGHHLFMRYLIKNFDHIGRLMTYFGINPIKEKYVVN